MAQNYIEWIRNYLINDPDVSAVVGDRVFWLRADAKTQTPFIVFNRDTQKNEIADFQGAWWINVMPMLFDVVVDYEQWRIWEELLRLLVSKMNGKHEIDGYYAHFSRQRHLPPEQYTATNQVVLWSIYVVTERYEAL